MNLMHENLEQRLFAQSVDDDKARKVLQDVIRAMYSPQFIAELFKPQEMYTTASTKQIFEKLAHSSIMVCQPFNCCMMVLLYVCLFNSVLCLFSGSINPAWIRLEECLFCSTIRAT